MRPSLLVISPTRLDDEIPDRLVRHIGACLRATRDAPSGPLDAVFEHVSGGALRAPPQIHNADPPPRAPPQTPTAAAPPPAQPVERRPQEGCWRHFRIPQDRKPTSAATAPATSTSSSRCDCSAAFARRRHTAF